MRLFDGERGGGADAHNYKNAKIEQVEKFKQKLSPMFIVMDSRPITRIGVLIKNLCGHTR